MKMHREKCISMISYSIIIFLIILFVYSDRFFAETKQPVFQKGFSFCCYCNSCCSKEESYQSLKNLKDLGVEWVAIIVTWYQKDSKSTDIYPAPSSASDESIIYIIEKAHSEGLKVMLKPQLDCEDGTFRGWINFLSDEEWSVWFINYKKFILHYAKLAQIHKVEQFCIGTELTSSISYEENWREIIKDIRKIYSGYLTYAANWDEYEKVKFWDELDYAGIDAYFPLWLFPSPDISLLVKGWKIWLRNIEEWQKKISKPVIFTEIGYRSIEGASKLPWDWKIDNKVNLSEQANCYEATFKTFYNKPWFYGFYWWCWEPDENIGGEKDKGFTPYKKPAGEILKKWYSSNER